MVLRPGPEQTPISSHHNILNFVYCVYAMTKICNWFLLSIQCIQREYFNNT